MRVFTLGEVVGEAVESLNVFGGGRTDIVETGIGPIDRDLGGLFGDEVGILATDTGIGKTSMMLTAAMTSPAVHGIVSAEDGLRALGSRALASESGVSSQRMRRPEKFLRDRDMDVLRVAYDSLRERDNVLLVFPPRKTPEGLREASEALLAEGAEMLWLDYIQKFRGSGLDRRNEVGSTFTLFGEVCREGDVPGMALSQYKRRDIAREPRLGDLKESGDLENECRLCIVGWEDHENPRLVNFRVAKSSYGAKGKRFQYRRDDSGTLREMTYDDSDY